MMKKLIDEYKYIRPEAFVRGVVRAVYSALSPMGGTLPIEINISKQKYETLTILIKNKKIEKELEEYDIHMCHIGNDYFFADTLILPEA